MNSGCLRFWLDLWVQTQPLHCVWIGIYIFGGVERQHDPL